MRQRNLSGLARLRLLEDKRGLTTVEYAIVLCLIAAVAVGVWDAFGTMVAKQVGTSTETLEGPMEKGAAGGEK